MKKIVFGFIFVLFMSIWLLDVKNGCGCEWDLKIKYIDQYIRADQGCILRACTTQEMKPKPWYFDILNAI